MKPVLVDSNIILDVITNDPVWGAWSTQALEEAANRGSLIINALIYAEVSIGFERIEDLEACLPQDVFHREALPYEAAFLAGKSFMRYRKQGGARVSPLPDFYIGAHAAVANYKLLTRDQKRYRTYYPTVELLAPE